MRVNTTSLQFSIIVLILFSSHMHCEPRPPFACDPSDTKTGGFPFCNTKTNMSIRVQDLIVKLTLPEKISLLVDKAKPVDRLGIQGYEWWSEALHGVSNTGPGVQFGGKFPGATSFPQVITTAASLNASLWEAIGQVVSDEARAMYNWGQAGLTFWSPNVNIFRDPRWGRGQETPGEDPLVVSTYAVNYVKGLQGEEDRKNMLKVAACCKHYTAYDLDAWNGTDRFRFNAVVSEQDLEETYNVPFKACVSEGNVASIMCSYNQVNGKPTCADPILLRDTIRRQWKLNGYIVSDCDSVDVFFRRQHYTSTPEDAAAIAIKAGLDLDCGSFLGIHTMKAIQTRKLNVSDVDQALSNLITVQMRLGMYDGPTAQPYSNLGPNNVCTPAHQQLALEAAQQGIVLLKNLEWTLPLCSKWSPTIAVIGPNADATRTMIGNYAGVPCSYTSPLKGISEYVNTTYEIGCTTLKCFGNPHYREAERAARTARATVLVMGLDQSIEREGLDRVGLLLPGNQQNLVSRVAQASTGPVVLVIMSGGPVDITFAKNDPNIDAILWVGYPGQAGGTAIADVIFGKVNPGGKLPMTWYPEEYLAKVPMTDMSMRSDPKTDYPGRTYKFYNGSVVYNFGDGLSYTHFKHTLANGPKELLIPSKNTTTLSSKGDIRVSDTACEALRLEVLIDVENVGELDGAETVMAFVTTPSKEKSLVGFKKSYLAVKAKVRVEFKIDPCQQMSVVDQYGIRRIEIGEYQIKFGQDLTYNVTLYTNKKKSVMF